DRTGVLGPIKACAGSAGLPRFARCFAALTGPVRAGGGGSCPAHGRDVVMGDSRLLHQRLVAYQVALECLRAVHSASIRDADQRGQARKSAASVARNIAEGAGRASRADKARVYAIARGEVRETCGAVEIAEAIGCACAADVARVHALGKRPS